MSLPYLGLLEWLSASTEREKAEVWLSYNPAPVKPFNLRLNNPYKPKIVLYFLKLFLFVAIYEQREAWLRIKYPTDPDLKNFWFSPLGQFYWLYFNIKFLLCTFGSRLDRWLWVIDFNFRRFLIQNFPGRR